MQSRGADGAANEQYEGGATRAGEERVHWKHGRSVRRENGGRWSYAPGDWLDCCRCAFALTRTGELRASVHRLRYEPFGAVFDRRVGTGRTVGSVRAVSGEWRGEGARADSNFCRLLHFADTGGVVASTSTPMDYHVDQSVVGVDRRWVGGRDGDELRVDRSGPRAGLTMETLSSRWMRLPLFVRLMVVAVFIGVEVFLIANYTMGGSDSAPTYSATLSQLRGAGIELFPPTGGYRSVRAVIVFFGNDRGFTRAHRRLSAGLASDGYAVVGVTLAPLLSGIPDDAVTRARLMQARIDSLVSSAYAEFSAWPDKHVRNTHLPLVLMGQSLGAEIAIWSASNNANSALRGVVALSPAPRTALRRFALNADGTAVSKMSDSVTVSDLVRTTVSRPTNLRIAIVRGSHDRLRSADSGIVAAGGAHAKVFRVPMAGHSLARLAIVGLLSRRALDWVLEPRPLVARSIAPTVR